MFCTDSDWPADVKSCSGRRHRTVLVFIFIRVFYCWSICAHRGLVLIVIRGRRRRKKIKYRESEIEASEIRGYKNYLNIFGRNFAPEKLENQVSFRWHGMKFDQHFLDDVLFDANQMNRGVCLRIALDCLV